MGNIRAVVPVGMQQTYDIEVEHPDHQFYLANGILSSNSHSVAYAIDSYYAGWLATYYPKEWLATILQSESGNPDKLGDTISQIKRLGYKFAAVDINYSGMTWQYSEELQAFFPPLTSVKGVGETAAEEIIRTRPFKNLHDLFWNADGEWYHSKMNKTSFVNLCKVEGFSSLEEFRSGKIKHHRQLHDIFLQHHKALQKGPFGLTATKLKKAQKKGETVPYLLDTLITSYPPDDWTREEKILHNFEILNSVDNDLLFPAGLLGRLLGQTKVVPITKLPSGVTGLAWFLVAGKMQKSTKNGKPYVIVKAQDNMNNSVNLRIWGGESDDYPLFSVWLCEAKGDTDWGPSTNPDKLKRFKV